MPTASTLRRARRATRRRASERRRASASRAAEKGVFPSGPSVEATLGHFIPAFRAAVFPARLFAADDPFQERFALAYGKARLERGMPSTGRRLLRARRGARPGRGPVCGRDFRRRLLLSGRSGLALGACHGTLRLDGRLLAGRSGAGRRSTRGRAAGGGRFLRSRFRGGRLCCWNGCGGRKRGRMGRSKGGSRGGSRACCRGGHRCGDGVGRGVRRFHHGGGGRILAAHQVKGGRAREQGCRHAGEDRQARVAAVLGRSCVRRLYVVLRARFPTGGQSAPECGEPSRRASLRGGGVRGARCARQAAARTDPLPGRKHRLARGTRARPGEAQAAVRAEHRIAGRGPFACRTVHVDLPLFCLGHNVGAGLSGLRPDRRCNARWAGIDASVITCDHAAVLGVRRFACSGAARLDRRQGRRACAAAGAGKRAELRLSAYRRAV